MILKDIKFYFFMVLIIATSLVFDKVEGILIN